ncbi:MAG: beta strand repeat-containing protein, partial [Chitinophagaceae bacterium]
MKKFVYTILLLLTINQSYAATYYWIGGTAPTVNFANNANWTTDPTTRVPVATTGTLTIAASDVFIFDGTNVGGTTVVTGNVVINTTGTFGPFAQLKLINGANVSFSRTSAGTTRFNINGDGTTAPDLVVDATSSFTLGGMGSGYNAAIALDTVNQNATGFIEGSVYISPLSSNNGSHTASFILAGTGELVFASGSACYSSDTTTASCFNGSAANSVIFKSGSSLYYFTGRSPIGSSSTKQFTVFEPGSNYYVRGNNVSYVDGVTPYSSSSWTSGKSFANIFVQNGSTYTSDGAPVRIGNLTVEASCTFVTHTSGQTPILGNLIVNGTVNAVSGTNSIVMGGNSLQTISGTGTITVPSFVVCDNSDVVLSTNVTSNTTTNIVGKLNFGATNKISGTATFTARVAGTAASVTGNLVAGSYQINGVVGTLSGNTGLSVSGTGIAPNTNVVGFSSSNAIIYLSKPIVTSGTAVALTFSSAAATLETANPNGFDSLTGCVTVTGLKSFASGTNYIINAPTTYPIGISSTVTTAMTVGNIALNAPVTTNFNTRVNGALTLNNGKFTIRPTDTVRIFSGNDILGFPFNNSKYIVTANNGSKVGVLRIDTFNTPKAFPVGTTANYLPVKLAPSDFSNFCVSVYQEVTNDATLSGAAFSAAQKASVVDAMWFINRTKGSGNSEVFLYWENGLEGSDFTNYTNNQIGISRYDGTAWTTSNALSADNAVNFSSDTASSFGAFGVGKIGAILPVILSNINATSKNNIVVLSWNATNEINVEKYDIERSVDGRNYTIIG